MDQPRRPASNIFIYWTRHRCCPRLERIHLWLSRFGRLAGSVSLLSPNPSRRVLVVVGELRAPRLVPSRCCDAETSRARIDSKDDAVVIFPEREGYFICLRVPHKHFADGPVPAAILPSRQCERTVAALPLLPFVYRLSLSTLQVLPSHHRHRRGHQRFILCASNRYPEIQASPQIDV